MPLTSLLSVRWSVSPVAITTKASAEGKPARWATLQTIPVSFGRSRRQMTSLLPNKNDYDYYTPIYRPYPINNYANNKNPGNVSKATLPLPILLLLPSVIGIVFSVPPAKNEPLNNGIPPRLVPPIRIDARFPKTAPTPNVAEDLNIGDLFWFFLLVNYFILLCVTVYNK